MKALMLAIPFVFLSQSLRAQEDSSSYLSHRTYFWRNISWHDTTSSIRSEEDGRNWVWPRFPTPLTLESWQEFKADTLARRYVRWISQSFIFDSIRAGFHRMSWHSHLDTTWAIAQPTFEDWMGWLERKRASEH